MNLAPSIFTGSCHIDPDIGIAAITGFKGTRLCPRNKLVLNISKIKSIVFGTNHSLNPKPQLHLVMNNVEIEQVDVSWSKHINKTVAKMRRSLSIINRCSAFLTILSTRQVLLALVLLHLDYCSVAWSGATKRDLEQLQFAQNRAARLALKSTHRANIDDVHVNLLWLKVVERLTSSQLVFVRGVDKLNAPSCLFKILGHPCIPHKTCH